MNKIFKEYTSAFLFGVKFILLLLMVLIIPAILIGVGLGVDHLLKMSPFLYRESLKVSHIRTFNAPSFAEKELNLSMDGTEKKWSIDLPHHTFSKAKTDSFTQGDKTYYFKTSRDLYDNYERNHAKDIAKKILKDEETKILNIEGSNESLYLITNDYSKRVFYSEYKTPGRIILGIMWVFGIIIWNASFFPLGKAFYRLFKYKRIL